MQNSMAHPPAGQAWHTPAP